nr:MAG TPA: hypothetical protein [Caudoviricetes sp.]
MPIENYFAKSSFHEPTSNHLFKPFLELIFINFCLLLINFY